MNAPSVRAPTGRPGTRELGALLRRLPPLPRPDELAAPDTVVHVPSRPDTVVWGVIPRDRPGVATVSPGARLRIDTVSHQGMLTTHPFEFFGAFGIDRADVLDDVVQIYEHLAGPEEGGSHVLTGPVHVEGAEPGDVLEIRIVAADLRVGYGINHGWRGGGVLPSLLSATTDRLVHVDASGRRLVFADGISIPIAPFPGIVTLASDAAPAMPSRPPHRCGGNLDLKDLIAGSRLFLPVSVPGAQLYMGDPHSAQGDGEVNGTAVEHSSSYTVELLLHRRVGLRWPVAETPTHLIPLGIDEELPRALEAALQAAIDLLGGLTDGELDEAAAYALCSVAVDFGIAEAVNGRSVVRARTPKDIFDGGIVGGEAGGSGGA